MALSKDGKRELSESQEKVLRGSGTEAPYTGALLNNKENGDYTCADCGQVLFSSATKFDSGTGWPSFYDVVNNEAVAEKSDMSMGMRRVEVSCKGCDAHLGHLFPDGPNPTGLRYCINSVCLDFQKK